MRILLLLSILLTLTVQKAVADGDSAALGPPQFSINLSAATPNEAASKYFLSQKGHATKRFSARKEHIANALLVAGGICLAIGIPLYITGAVKLSKTTYIVDNSFEQVIGGMMLTGTGVCLAIPGGIIKIVNHRRR